MLPNLLKDRVLLIQKQASQGVLGQTITYKPIQWKYASVIPLNAYARAQYQQLHSEATHRILFRGDVTITLGGYRIKDGSKTYEPAEPSQLIDGNTVIVVKEI